jgi:hypothetical protein
MMEYSPFHHERERFIHEYLVFQMEFFQFHLSGHLAEHPSAMTVVKSIIADRSKSKGIANTFLNLS